MGYYNYGDGFIFSDDNPSCESLSKMRDLIDRNPRNRERIFPIIGGSEMLKDPTIAPKRFVIDFGTLTEAEARAWPDLMAILESRVRPDRQKCNRDRYRDYWWQFAELRIGLRNATAGIDRFLMHPFTSSHLAFSFIPSDVYVTSPHYALIIQTYSGFACLQGRTHELWTRFFASSLEDRMRYTASDCFETFPFPKDYESDSKLEQVGRDYYEFRAALMVRNDEGLTKTYNRFHDPVEKSPDILKLRELHAAMDRAVIDAYGWDIKDEDLVCEFIPDFTEEDDDGNEIPKNIRYRWRDEVRDDILARLLALNAERYQAEVNAGLHSKGATKPKAAKKAAKKVAKPKEIPTEEPIDDAKVILFPDAKPEKKTRQGYSLGFARQLVAAEILAECHAEPTMGRVKLQKLLHLCEYHGQFGEMTGEYMRDAAGPFDRKMMFGVVSGLKKQKWFADVPSDKGTRYIPLEKFGGHRQYLEKLEGDLGKMRELIRIFKTAKSSTCEIASTLYAAWNDFLLEGKNPSDAEIIEQASSAKYWHASKEDIPSDKWPTALAWMREKGIIPVGWGAHTGKS